MGFAGVSPLGRVATWLATWFIPPFYSRIYLAGLNLRGYISPRATICHRDLRLGAHVYIDDRVLIYQEKDGGSVELGHGVHLHRDTIIQTGVGGSVTVGAHTHIQPRCQFSAYKAPIQIGCCVEIAPNCAFYPYNHGFAADKTIREQPLQTKGGIFVDDNAWLGVNVIILDGVRIGKGSVIGAGSVVTQDVPDGAIAVGVPARVIAMRSNLPILPSERQEFLSPQRGV
jgi:acetyltransferase-like isoleucine patch superfamily enzyme